MSEPVESLQDDNSVLPRSPQPQRTGVGRISASGERSPGEDVQGMQKLPSKCVESVDALAKEVQNLVGKQGNFTIEMRNGSYIIKSSSKIELKELLKRIAPRRRSFNGTTPALPTLDPNIDLGLGPKFDLGVDVDPEHRRLVGQDRRGLEEMDASA